MEEIRKLLYLEKYQKCRTWILDARKNMLTWDKIKYANKEDKNGLDTFLARQADDNFWDLSSEQWFKLVDQLKTIEENGTPGFIGEPNKPILSAPQEVGTCWVKYKQKLIDSNFSFESIANIEKSTIKIISQLEKNTEPAKPVRGIVVGNVQSGKTANMAAVMAMAADYGYNFFIVLSGTIDNLRKQTRDRLIGDLRFSDSLINFTMLDNLSAKTPNPDRLQDLFLEDNSRHRYLTVCLKNSRRLEDLLIWLNQDKNKKSKLKILVIDDEADQAGINTGNMSKDKQTAINKLIKSLVFARNSQHQESTGYQCMNYIGYTATPYANFLNEANDKSLYPVNFINTLISPSEYIGPQQIFGLPDVNLGLPIVNKIDDNEVKSIQDKTYIENNYLPDGLKQSILWFICSVAAFRCLKLSKTVSMLIHTSQIVENHDLMAKQVKSFLSEFFKSETATKELEKVWNEQKQRLSYSRFCEDLPNYSSEKCMCEYPDFDELIPELQKIFNIGLTNIKLDDESQTLQYNEGIHLCVDNCSKHALEEDNVYMRLVYPDKNNKEVLKKCPAFLVIGGATLSRGLTLEGLTCSYFLRTTTMADTLMQMGRWFGYRFKYELLPRLWLSNRTIGQFKRLTKLDCDLREELHNMESLSLSPKMYGPRLDSFPDYKILKITSRNKMQSAYEIECDFTNKCGQTTKFYNDSDIIKNNFNHTKEFINSLGPINHEQLKKLNNKLINEDTFMWLDCNYDEVLTYLGKLKYPNQLATINDINYLKEWFKKEYDFQHLKNWTVILSSVKKNKKTNSVKFDNFELFLPTRRKLNTSNDDFILLKTITAPQDRLLDVNCSNFTDFERENLFGSNSGETTREKRIKYGLIDTPLLVIYIIDKDSGIEDEVEIKNESNERLPLNTSEHLVGYDIYIPYGKTLVDKMESNKVTVKLEFDTKGDIDEDEN